MSPALWDVLACPVDHAPVKVQVEAVVCTQCGRQFPVREGIPVMLVGEAAMPKAPTKKTSTRAPKGS